jgi:S-adenosylmethionine-diacylglycerol 3-amino-3-carboxypropyl transferase
VHSRRAIAALLQKKDDVSRLRFYRERWNNVRWRLMFQIFFSRFVMGRAGRDPEFFRYVEGSVADRIFRRAEYALSILPTHSNPYLTYIFTGNYGENVPRYLRRDVVLRLRQHLDSLHLVHGSIDDAAAASEQRFDGFNLSDIFEYLDPPSSAALYHRLLERANPGARFAYWNMLVPRQRPDDVAGRVTRDEKKSRELFEQDLAFFYRDFILEVVR